MKMKRLALVFPLLISLANIATAGDCRVVGSVCVDSTPVKNVSGLNISVSQVGGCWEYEDTYECIGSPSLDYCAAINSTPGCSVTNSTCNTTAFNGTCIAYTKTYQCTNTSVPPGAGIIDLGGTYTITYENIDTSPCSEPASDATCHLSQKVCIDGPGTRAINGVDIYRDCWEWREDYSCVISSAVDYCQPLKAANCAVKAEVCTKYALTGECIEKSFDYLCDNSASPTPTEVILLDTPYSVIDDTIDTAQCTSLETNPNCSLASEVCVDGPGTKNVEGIDIYKDCWKWDRQYTCSDSEQTSTCADLAANPLCTEIDAVCVDTLASGACGLLEHQYRCADGSAVTGTQTNCGLQTFCIDGSCFDTGYSPDTDFGLAITNMEAIREAASYGLFVGEENECHKNVLVNCCKSEGGGQGGRNDSIASEIGSAAFTAGSEVIQVWGSRYVFEGLMNSGSSLLSEYAMSALGGALEMTGTFTVWGAEFSVAAEGISFVGFDPTSLALSIAIYFIMQMMQCEEEEQALAMKRGQGLCHKVGSYCANKVLGACVTKKEGWCCFPSKLGRIVNEQGRAQIGKGWGDAEDPDCSGFTTTELGLLRFDEMDLSEFIRDITPSPKTSNYAIERLSTQAASYY